MKGRAVAQPNTFSADGETTYVTSSQPTEGDCNLWALSTVTGEVKWCLDAGPGAIWSAVEVDIDGHLYLAARDAIVSVTSKGDLRWTRDVGDGVDPELDNGPVGLHFTPDGHIATVTSQGIVMLIERERGKILTEFDVPQAFRVDRPAVNTAMIDVGDLLPEAVTKDFQNFQFGPVSALLAVFAGAANFCDNTIAIDPSGHLYVIGSGIETGGLFQVKVGGTPEQPTLSAGWSTPTQLGSASSPAIGPDGRFAKVSDGNADTAFLDPSSVDAKTRIVDIQACNDNRDENKDPKTCAEAYVVPLQTGPTMGTHPMLANGIHYQYEIQVSDLLNTDKIDLRALRGDTVLWEVTLPDQLQWTSVITVTDEHLIGTATRFTDSGDALFTVELPATAKSELLIVNRSDGRIVFRAPTTDDSTSTVTVGRDGALCDYAVLNAHPSDRHSTRWRNHQVLSHAVDAAVDEFCDVQSTRTAPYADWYTHRVPIHSLPSDGVCSARFFRARARPAWHAESH